MKLSYELLFLSAEWIVRLGALVVIPQRRSPSSARAWLLLIFFLPMPGLILFLAIGNDRFPKWRRARFQSLRPFFEATADSLRPFQAFWTQGSLLLNSQLLWDDSPPRMETGLS